MPPALFHPDGWLRVAVVAVNAILVIALARSLAGLTLAMLTGYSPAPAGSPMPVGSTPGSENPAITEPVDYAAIGSWHLFGRLETDRPVETPTTPAPATSLNLRLVGIFFMERSSDRALALIADGGGPERGYRIGELLPGGARLQRIQRDHVIVSRGNREEVLNLPKLGEISARSVSPSMPPLVSPDLPMDVPPDLPPEDMSPDMSPDMPPDMPEPEVEPEIPVQSQVIDASALAERLRSEATSRLQALEDFAFASPYVQNNQFVGFRLRQGRDRNLLRQLGLNSGDVVTEINGSRLNSPAQGVSLLRDVLNADRISVRVLRNGVEIPLTFSLNGRSPR